MDDPGAQKARSAPRAFLRWALWVLVALISCLATVPIAPCGSSLESAKVDTTRTTLYHCETALKLYHRRHGRYPEGSDGLNALVGEKILESVPRDAWGNDIGYALEDLEHYRLTSYGADGALGGEGSDADIVVHGPRPRN